MTKMDYELFLDESGDFSFKDADGEMLLSKDEWGIKEENGKWMNC